VNELFQLHEAVLALEVGADGCKFASCLCTAECQMAGNALQFWCSYDDFRQEVMQSADPQVRARARARG